VNTWLEHTLAQARRHAPNHLLTVGWSSAGHAATLSHMVDIVSFHFYAPAPELPAAYASLRAAAPDLPLLLGEFGLPTWNSPFFPHGHSESEQARYYAEILAHQRASGSSGYLAWTLYDFNRVPASVAGGWPWQVGPQRHLGVLRPDGTPKQTAALLHPGAVLDVPPLPPWDRWLKPFWLTVYMVFGLVGWLAWRWLKHMKASRKGAKLAKEGG
ncbi:MAG: hypothetical protein MUD01_23170, partial [Chloroflexaceae bacterium]|nr:hypothetical protein [Chloroflexaceae bacterium]